MQEREPEGTKREKIELRKQILKNRNALSLKQRQTWDRQILEYMIGYDRKTPCSAYLCYVNYRSEVSTKEFILWCLDNKKTVFVPKVLINGSPVIKNEKGTFGKTEEIPAEMEFYQIVSWEELQSGYQGILEPEALPERAFPEWLARTEKLRMSAPRCGKEAAGKPESVHFRMLLPGAVFDKKGNRIGYGGGFYDRWLAKWSYFEKSNRNILEKIGLAYDMQMVETLPAEPFDRKVDCIITEENMY